MIAQIWKEAGTIKVSNVNQQIALSELIATMRGITAASPHSHHAEPRDASADSLGGADCGRSDHCCRGMLLRRSQLSLSSSASDGPELPDLLVLVAIADIDRPYQGDVRSVSDGFEFAMQTFNK